MPARHLSLLPALLLAGTITAQATTFTSPGGFATTEGVGWAQGLGAEPYARYSIQDGSFRNRSLSLKQVATRPDHRWYQGVGRRWYKVVVRMSECVIANNQTTWTRMAVTTPNEVFAKSVAWPTISGPPPSKPLPFNRRFPFSSTYVYSGRNDLNTEFEFIGGVLANSWPNRTWTAYPADAGHDTYGANFGRATTYGRGGPWGSGCVDGNVTFGNGATTQLSMATYGAQFGPDVSLRNRMDVNVTIQHTAAGRPVVCTLGVAGGFPGTTFPGVSCNQHYIDLSKPAIFLRRQAGGGGTTRIPIARVTADARLVGFRLFAQSGWSDSKTGQFKLTTAQSAAIPPIPQKLPERYAYYSNDWRKTVASGPHIGPGLLPIFQFTR